MLSRLLGYTDYFHFTGLDRRRAGSAGLLSSRTAPVAHPEIVEIGPRGFVGIGLASPHLEVNH